MFPKRRLTAAVPLMVLILSLATACSLLNSPPVASFTLTAGSWRSPAIVSCDASACTDPDGIVVKYEWTFGDGSTGSGESTSHTYTSSGEYAVVLQVIDDEGKTASVSETVNVLPPYVYEPSPPLPTPPVYPEPVVSSSHIRFEGYGSPLSRIRFTSGGAGIFFIDSCTASIFDQHGGWVGFLEGGRKTIALAAGEVYYLGVAAYGAWVITILSTSYHPSPPQTYTGQGQELSQYTSLFTLDQGTATFYIEHEDGPGYDFSVVLLDSERDWVEVLLDTYKSFNDRVEVDVPFGGGVYLLKIRAGNDWEVSVEQ